MRVASPVLGRTSRGRWLALFVLAVANVGLIAVVAGGFSSLADVIAPLTGHLIGIGLAASMALLMRRRMLALLAAGVAATLAVHAWLGLGALLRGAQRRCRRRPTARVAGGRRRA